MSQSTEEILNLERALWEQADDAAVFARIFADDGIAVMEPMGVVTKQKALTMIPDKPWRNLELRDVTSREVSPDCVVLAYHGIAQNPKDDKPYKTSVCSTYLRRGGEWQLVLSAHQPWSPDQQPSAG